MKKQIIAAISTHPVRAAFLLILLFLLGSVMHQALGQGNSGKRSVAANLSQVARPLTGAITGAISAPAGANLSGAVVAVPTLPQSQFATGSNVPTNSITTLFASNNNGNPGGAVYFDLTVASSPISVTALDINTASTASFSNFRVYVLPGMTFQGNETNMGLWTQVATGSGTGAGLNLPTHVTLSNPITLNAGTLYGIALVADPAFEHRYTNGNGSNQNYSNADVSLFLGSAGNVPFTAPVFFPRVWNGTVYYDVGGGCSNYTTTTSTGAITPGSTDSGSHCDDCATLVTFPFPVSVYGQTFNSANLSSNGSLDLIGSQAPFTHGCQVLPNTLWTMAIFPYQDDLRTDQFSGCAGFPGGTCGIFTSTTGTAPNRQFNVEWRAVHFADTTASANFSVAFHEGQTSFDVIYGATSDSGLDETSGVQASSTGAATTFSCGTPTLTNGLKVTYACAGGGGGGCQFHVLIVYTDTALPTQLQSEIQAEPNVVAVDLFDAQAGTPTLGQLQQYEIVVPYSNFPFLDADTLGNNLADYVDGGGVVVQYGFSHYGPSQPYGVNGRWVTGNYNPYTYSTNLVATAFTLGAFNAAHPLMAGVTTLNSDFQNIVALAAGATQVAAASNSNSLVAYRPVSGGHTTVGVTAYVGADATQSGDWGRVIVNAGRWLGGSCGPVPSSAVSRKVHGAFTGDINLPLVAIGGAVGIECRNGAGSYQMVVTFPSPVTVGGVSVTSGTGSVGSSSVSGGVVTINLIGVADTQRLGVTLANVNDGTNAGDVFVPMGMLIGDSAGTGNGSVNAGDVGFVKSQSGVAVGAGNFRADVAINGTINASDIGQVKSNSGHSLPP